MFNTEKMRKTMVVVMLLELLILLGILVHGHIQDETRLRQQVQAVTTQIATIEQRQEKIAYELKIAEAMVQALDERATRLEKQSATLLSDSNTLKQEVQTQKKTCASKSTCCKSKCTEKSECKSKSSCCKSKCKGKSDCGNSCNKRSPNKDKPSHKKPECGNDKGTTSPPAMHQVEMYYGATKVIVSVPPAIPISK